MTMREKVLIVGNKKYENLDISNLSNSQYFDEIYRCNFGLPKKDSNTRYGHLAMCNHIYEFFISNPRPLADIICIYTEFEKEFLTGFYNRFQEEKHRFDKVYYQMSSQTTANRFLSKYNGSPRFKLMPRTGHALIIKLLTEGKDVFVHGFTIEQDEPRISHGTIAELSDKSPHHSKKEEVEVLNWLHKSGIIDASFCYLKDEEEIQFDEKYDGLITQRAKKILESVLYENKKSKNQHR